MRDYTFPFEKLEVWQEAVVLACFILNLLENLQSGRHNRLISQLEGAVVSVSQNIAEGKGRQHKKEFLQYLSIAQGSLYETVTLVEIYDRQGLFSKEQCQEIRKRAEGIDRKLNGLMSSVRGRKRI